MFNGIKNFINRNKKEAVMAATIVTAATAMGQGAPKTADKLTEGINKTIAYSAPESKVQAVSFTDAKNNLETKKSLKQELEEAQANLIKTQLEFQTAHAKLLEKFKHDGFTTNLLNDISDYDKKISLFVKGFLNGRTASIDDLADSTNIQKYIAAAKDFSRDERSTTTWKETESLETLTKGVLGSLIYQEGYGTDGNLGSTIVTKDQVERTLWSGDNNIIDRLIEAEIMVYAKKAQLEKQNTMDLAVNNVNNLDNLASK